MLKEENIRTLCDTNELIKYHKAGMSIKRLSDKYKIDENKILDFLEEYFEKEEYCNEKYGKGKWKFMSSKELKDNLVAYNEFKKENPNTSLSF